eukprot:m.24132 g.24132  ORF g.24132 m.24132 type:complete len:95 (+) comp7578_c0_seq2:173-457(+)
MQSSAKRFSASRNAEAAPSKKRKATAISIGNVSRQRVVQRTTRMMDVNAAAAKSKQAVATKQSRTKKRKEDCPSMADRTQVKCTTFHISIQSAS